jgi:hypothetical protein
LGPFKLNTAADWAELVKSNSVRALSLAGMRYRVAVFCSSTAIMKPDSAMAHVGKGFELVVVDRAPEEPAGEAVELETSEVKPIEEAVPGVELLPTEDCAAPELDAAELLPDVDDAAPEPEATELPAAELDTTEVEELADDDWRLELEAANEVLEQAPPETVTVLPPTVSVEVTVEGGGGGMTTVVVVVPSCVTVRVSMSVTSRVAAGCVIVIAAAVSVIVRVSMLVISRVAAGSVTVISGAVIVTVMIEVMSAVIPGPVITSVIAAGVTETVVVPLYTV